MRVVGTTGRVRECTSPVRPRRPVPVLSSEYHPAQLLPRAPSRGCDCRVGRDEGGVVPCALGTTIDCRVRSSSRCPRTQSRRLPPHTPFAHQRGIHTACKHCGSAPWTPVLAPRHDGCPCRAHGTARSVLLVECIMRMREALVHTLLQLTLYPPWHKGPGQCSATHTLARRCTEQGGHEQRQTPRTRSGAAAASAVQRTRSPVRTAATPRSALYATTHAPPLRVDHAHETGAATPALDADLTPLPAWTRMAQQ